MMISKTRPGLLAGAAAASAIAVSALLIGAGPVSAASPVTAISSSSVHPDSGSGTVNDPWVPSKSATIVCQSATVWGNYSPGSGHSTPLGTVYSGDTVSVRYETADHNSVMSYSARANTWGFILRSCVQFA